MALKDRVLIKFPARVLAQNGVMVTLLNGVYTFALYLLGYTTLTTLPTPTTTKILVIDDNGDGTSTQRLITVSNFLAQAVSQTVQVITAGGTQAINTATTLVIVNQTVGAAITLTLPLSSSKVGPVKVVDWKGDAGTNNITLARTSTDTFNGSATSWTIGGDNASLVFTPYSGSGYAV